jgi:hypothetical protein
VLRYGVSIAQQRNLLSLHSAIYNSVGTSLKPLSFWNPQVNPTSLRQRKPTKQKNKTTIEKYCELHLSRGAEVESIGVIMVPRSSQQ